jgi:hypothetical protein
VTKAMKIWLTLVGVLGIAAVVLFIWVTVTDKLKFLAGGVQNYVEISADRTEVSAGETLEVQVSGEPEIGSFSGLMTTLEWEKGTLTFMRAENANFYLGSTAPETVGKVERLPIKAVLISKEQPKTKTVAAKIIFTINQPTKIKQTNTYLLLGDSYEPVDAIGNTLAIKVK